MQPYERYLLAKVGPVPMAPFVYPVIQHRRELIRRARGVNLGLLDVMAFWDWVQERVYSPWTPIGGPTITNAEILAWWDKFVAYTDNIDTEFRSIPVKDRVGDIPVWTPEKAQEMLDAYGFEPLPEETP